MKALAVFCLSFAWASLCLGGPIQSHHAAVAKKKTAPGGGGSWGSPTTTLYSETAEGTGTPAGWTDTGAPDWDATDQFKNGAQSFKVEAGKYSKAPNVNNGELWFNFWMRADTFPASTENIFNGLDTGFATILRIRISSSGEMILADPTATATTSAISTDTWVYVSVYYLAGAGSDSVGKIAWSTDGSSPSSGAQFATYTNGTAVAGLVHTYWSAETVCWLDDITAKAP